MFSNFVKSVLGSWQGILTLVLLGLAVVGGAGLYIYHQGDVAGSTRIQGDWDKAKADMDAAVQRQRAADQLQADQIQAEAVSAVAGLNQQIQALQGRVSDEINHNNIYHSCVVPASGVRLFNQNAVQPSLRGAARPGTATVPKT